MTDLEVYDWLLSHRISSDKVLTIVMSYPDESWRHEARFIVNSHVLRDRLMKSHKISIVISKSKTEARIHIVFP